MRLLLCSGVEISDRFLPTDVRQARGLSPCRSNARICRNEGVGLRRLGGSDGGHLTPVEQHDEVGAVRALQPCAFRLCLGRCRAATKLRQPRGKNRQDLWMGVPIPYVHGVASIGDGEHHIITWVEGRRPPQEERHRRVRPEARSRAPVLRRDRRATRDLGQLAHPQPSGMFAGDRLGVVDDPGHHRNEEVRELRPRSVSEYSTYGGTTGRASSTGPLSV